MPILQLSHIFAVSKTTYDNDNNNSNSITTMKRLSIYLLGLIGILFSLTSCDEDVSRSVVLSGEWEGNFGMYYDYEYVTNRGERRVETFNCYRTYLQFVPDYDYATHGYGFQDDYYRRGPFEYRHYDFRWEVRDEQIYMMYDHHPELDTVIRDYSMNENYFRGYCSGATEKFYLTKLHGYYWTDEDICRDNWYYDDFYYAPETRAAEASAPSADDAPAESRPSEENVRLGRHTTF